MTYLDPDESTHHPRWGRLILRALAIVALLVVGWYAFTLGDPDGTGRLEIVQEPSAQLQ